MTGECLRLLNTRIFANLPSELISLVQFWNCFCSFGFIDLVEYVV
jgi:hypothetical protein